MIWTPSNNLLLSLIFKKGEEHYSLLFICVIYVWKIYHFHASEIYICCFSVGRSILFIFCVRKIVLISLILSTKLIFWSAIVINQVFYFNTIQAILHLFVCICQIWLQEKLEISQETSKATKNVLFNYSVSLKPSTSKTVKNNKYSYNNATLDDAVKLSTLIPT